MKFGKYLSLVSLVLLLVAASVFGTAAIVTLAQNPFQKLPSTLDRFAYYVVNIPRAARGILNGSYRRLYLVSKASIPDFEQWQHAFPAPDDTGFLLYSGFDAAIESNAVRLIRISDGATLIDWDIKSHGKQGWEAYYSPTAIAEPLILPGGDIVVNIDGFLSRIRSCQSGFVWRTEKETHHSIEFDSAGNILTLSYLPSSYLENPLMAARVLDNSLLRVSPEGKVLDERSFSEILLRNGFHELLLGHLGVGSNLDPLHLNQLVEANRTTSYWNKGDLLISSRHMSTVFLYRPSTDKIIWHQTGPWLNQHSAYFVGDSQIALLDNNVVTINGTTIFLKPEDTNRVFVYDFATQQLSQPYADILKQLRPRTGSEGIARISGDGSLFLEETNYGRLMKMTPTRLQWSYINSAGTEDVAQLRLSRYYTRDEITAVLPGFNFDKTAKGYSGCVTP
jgi:Arylsulfotransferase (ASST)